MKLRANRKNLNTYAKDLLGDNDCPERRKALVKECLTGFQRDPHFCHISHDRANHIERIGKILGNCGCEGVLLDGKGNDVSGLCCDSAVRHDIRYSNAGDTYAMTVFYHNGKLFIGDWGSIVERLA